MSGIERSSLLQPCHASPPAERGEGSGRGQGGRGLRPPATGVLGTAWILKASLPHSVVYAGSSKVVGAFTPWKWADAANLGFGIFLDFFRFCCCCCHPCISTPMTAQGDPSSPVSSSAIRARCPGDGGPPPPACWVGFQGHRHGTGGEEGEGTLAFGVPVCGRREPAAQRREPSCTIREDTLIAGC